MSWTRSPRAVHTRTPRGGVLLHLDSKEYFALNETGQVLWNELAAPRTHEALANALTSTFEVREDAARRDAEAWLDAASRAGLIVAADVER